MKDGIHPDYHVIRVTLRVRQQLRNPLHQRPS